MTDRPRTPTRRVAAFAAAMLILAACGAEDDAADPTIAPEATAGAPVSDAPGATTGASEPPTSSVGSTPGSTVPDFSGDPDSEFCRVASELDAVNEEEPSNPFDPAYYEDFFRRARPMYDAAVAAAPPEIAGDVALAAASFTDMEAVFAAVGYQFLDVDLSELPNSAELDAAAARVDAYNEQVCGIEPDGDDSDPPTEGTMADLVAEEFVAGGATEAQAACMVDFLREGATGGSDFELGIGVMAACGFTQPLIDAGFTEEEAQCAVDYLSTAETSGSETEIGIALVAACGITRPLIDEGFSEEEAECIVDHLASAPDVDTSDATRLGLDVISACNITRFFTDQGFSEEDATCMVDRLAEIDDIADDEAVVGELVELCVTGGATPPTTEA